NLSRNHPSQNRFERARLQPCRKELKIGWALAPEGRFFVHVRHLLRVPGQALKVKRNTKFISSIKPPHFPE
ncbi:MAG TPA: hypothetical protein VHX20_05010, partial [Terracidiphilus sp.]|nr:hypothetical protein [Terracidiphilus sp.]